MKNLITFLSVDEQKLSALILCLFLLAGIAGYKYIYVGDISTNMKDLLEFIAGAIASMNIVNKIKGDNK